MTNNNVRAISPLMEVVQQIAGRHAYDEPLAKHTWFQVGGATTLLLRPIDQQGLSRFLRVSHEYDQPWYVIGAGSNILIRDGGLDCVVIKLAGAHFASISHQGTEVVVGAGTLDRTLALYCAQQGLSGLEFLVGIPGTVGGAAAMNAGAYGGEVIDRIKWVELCDEQGVVYRLHKHELHMEYRKSNLPKKHIVIRCAFELVKGEPKAIMTTCEQFLEQRTQTQPVKGRTGGSTFKNPDGGKAWELIDKAGCRGLRYGGAMVSDKHCNFLLNQGEARAAEIETLGNIVQQRVLENSGVELEWEIIRLGKNI